MITPLMTWNRKQKRWFKKYKKRQYVVSAKELGTGLTYEASVAAANRWWEAKKAELDREEANSRPYLAQWQLAVKICRLKARWLSKHKASPELHEMYWEQTLALADASPEERSLFPCDKTEAENNAAEINTIYEQLRQALLMFADAAEQKIKRGETLRPSSKDFFELEGVWAERLQFELDGSEEVRTVGPLVEEWIERKRALAQAGEIKPDRFSKYQYCINYFRDWLGTEKGVEEITTATLESYHTHLLTLVRKRRSEGGSEGCSDTYAKERIDTAKQFALWLFERDAIPLPKILMRKNALRIKVENKKPRIADPKVVKNLLNDQRTPERTTLYLLLMANCGMYPVDIANLEHHQISNHRITRKRSKTEGWENVPTVTYKLWKQTAKLLEKHLSSDSRFALLNEDGGRLQRKYIGDDGKAKKCCNITSACKRAIASLKIKLSMDQLRKTSSDLLYNNREFKELHTLFLGHSPRTVAEKSYVHADPKTLDKAIDWLAKQYDIK